MATATERQQIPIINPEPTEAERIFAMLDAAKALGRYFMFTIFADNFEEGIAEYAIRLWASANGRTLEEQINDYPDYTIRTLSVGHTYEQGSISLHFPPERKAQPAPAVVDTEAPPPNVIVPPADTWHPADPDDAITRFSLLELD